MEKFARMVFFPLLEIDEVGVGIVTQLYDAGYKNVSDILSLTIEQLQALEGFKERKAVKVFESIHKGLEDVPLHKLQHASNLFKGLGSRKLEPLAKYDSCDKKPTLEEVVAVEGYSDISASAYLEGFDKFWEWAEQLPITVAVYEAPKEGIYTGKNFVFTGFRSPELEQEIAELGGKITSSVSKNTYALVMKKKGSGSSKEKKALDLGVIVYEKEELEQIIKDMN